METWGLISFHIRFLRYIKAENDQIPLQKMSLTPPEPWFCGQVVSLVNSTLGYSLTPFPQCILKPEFPETFV